MSTILNMPIVVIAYNRPEQLARLLHSIRQSLEILDYRAQVLVSIDGGTASCVEVCNNFSGLGVETIARKTRLGLRQHVLACGDMLSELDSGIFLEDDLIVTPAALSFAMQATPIGRKQGRVAALSLYSFHLNEFARDWLPRQDVCGDVFYAQTSSSWGQVWWRDKWEMFRSWMSEGGSARVSDIRMPGPIKKWPDTSWKKLHNAFLAEANLFSMIPKSSVVFNCGAKGMNHTGQVNIAYSDVRVFHDARPDIRELDDAFQLDSFLELYHCPCAGQHRIGGISLDQIEFDIFGQKMKSDVRRPFVLTAKRQRRQITVGSYPISLGNPLAGALLNMSGEGLWLVRRENFNSDGPVYNDISYSRDRIAATGDRTLVRLAIDAIGRHIKHRLRLT
jgi:hypothetical protein